MSTTTHRKGETRRTPGVRPGVSWVNSKVNGLSARIFRSETMHVDVELGPDHGIEVQARIATDGAPTVRIAHWTAEGLVKAVEAVEIPDLETVDLVIAALQLVRKHAPDVQRNFDGRNESEEWR